MTNTSYQGQTFIPTLDHTLRAAMEYVEGEGVVALILTCNKDGIKTPALAEISQHL